MSAVPPPVPPRPRIPSTGHQSRPPLGEPSSSSSSRRTRSMSGGPPPRPPDIGAVAEPSSSSSSSPSSLLYSHSVRPLSSGRHANAIPQFQAAHPHPHPPANGLPPTGSGQHNPFYRAINEESEPMDGVDCNTNSCHDAYYQQAGYNGHAGPPYFRQLEVVDHLEADLLRETWSQIVDKKSLAKYSKAFVSRQSAIWELWTTERNFLRTLLVLRFVYQEQLEREIERGIVHLHPSKGCLAPPPLKQLFPTCLDELLDLHKNFFDELLKLQGEAPLRIVEAPIGPTLCAQFQADNGRRMAEAYGELNAHHDLYTRSDHLQQLFARQPELEQALHRYSKHEQCNKKTIGDCYLIVIQHLSKIKTLAPMLKEITKNVPEEEAALSKADQLIHDCLSKVDRLLETRQNQAKLSEVVQRFEPSAQRLCCAGQTWSAEELTKRQCLFAGKLEYRRDKQDRLDRDRDKDKYTDCYGLLLEDALVLLKEKNSSEVKQDGWIYTFFSADGKDHVIPFAHCQTVIREHNTGKLSSSKQPLEFLIMVTNCKPKAVAYQFLCSAHEGRDGCMTWINRLNSAKKKCPFVSEQVTKEAEEREDLLRKKNTSAQIHTQLRINEKNLMENISCNMQLLTQLLQLWGISGGAEQHLPEDSVTEVNKELARIALYVQSLGSSLTRSASNAEERRGSQVAAAGGVPKRAETFGGHDSKKPPIGVQPIARSTSSNNEEVKRRGHSGTGTGTGTGLSAAQSDSSESLNLHSPSHSQTLTVKRRNQGIYYSLRKDGSRRRNSVSLLSRIMGVNSGKNTSSSGSAATATSTPPTSGSGTESPGCSRRRSPDTRGESELELTSYSECVAVSAEQLSDHPPDNECLLSLSRVSELVSGLSEDVLTLRTETETLRVENLQLEKELKLEKDAASRGGSSDKKGYNQEHLLEAIRQQKTEFDKEKRAWEDSRRKERAHLEAQKDILEQKEKDFVERCRREQEELEKERSRLQEKSDRLQKQIDMHRSGSGSTPDLLDSPLIDRRHSQPMAMSPVPTLHTVHVQALKDPQHQRCHSDEASRAQLLPIHSHSRSALAGSLHSSSSTSRLPDAHQRSDSRSPNRNTNENGLNLPQRAPSTASAVSTSNLQLGLPKYLAQDNPNGKTKKKKNTFFSK